MRWKHTCTREENRQFLEENDQLIKQWSKNFMAKEPHYLYRPKEALPLNQPFTNRKRKSKSNSILRLTSLFCVPALQSITLLLSFVSILVSRASPAFPKNQLLPWHSRRGKAIPAEQQSSCPQRAGHWLAALEAQAEPKQISSAWSWLHPPGQGWLTSSGSLKMGLLEKKGQKDQFQPS